MKTLNIAISDIECAKFGITKEAISFSDFVDIISRELMKDNLRTSISEAAACGLSVMTMDEISAEVRAIRQNAKSNH